MDHRTPFPWRGGDDERCNPSHLLRPRTRVAEDVLCLALSALKGDGWRPRSFVARVVIPGGRFSVGAMFLPFPKLQLDRLELTSCWEVGALSSRAQDGTLANFV